jgi:hypothetical protein
VNILHAIADPNLFAPFLGNPATWQRWLAALAALYGLPIPAQERSTVRQCTGRKCKHLPAAGFDTALFLTGRRSGKSRIAAVIAAFEASLAGHQKKLSPGERGVVVVCAPTLHQSRIVHGYIRAIYNTPLLAAEVVSETKHGFELRDGTRIEILSGDWRTIRGYTLLAAVVDEAAFFGIDEDSHIKSDTELMRAIKPGLATVGGKLIAISTPYARKGWCFRTYERNHGNDNGKILVFNCPSRTLNPTLPQQVVDDALAEDLAAAKSEYLGEFRDDVCEFLPRSLIEALVCKGRVELIARPRIQYHAFADVSGGRNDDAALAIAHRAEQKVVIDVVRRYRPPCNPHDVIVKMCDVVREYGCRQVVGDNYAAEFVAGAFRREGVGYFKAEKAKSALYLELLPRLCSGEIELPDIDVLITQLASLERRTRSGGKDVVDHPRGAHDDLANAVAGVCESVGRRRLLVGGLDVLRSDENGSKTDVALSRAALGRAVAMQSGPPGFQRSAI